MTKQIETIKKVRALLLETIEGLNAEQLNKIPTGFSNNIIWNLAHMIAVQEGTCYKSARLPILTSNDFWERFKPGSKPGKFIEAEEIAQIKQLLFVTLDQLQTDYNKQIFGNYIAWSTRFGVDVTSIDDGLHFLQFHERLHSGTIAAIKSVLLN